MGRSRRVAVSVSERVWRWFRGSFLLVPHRERTPTVGGRPQKLNPVVGARFGVNVGPYTAVAMFG